MQRNGQFVIRNCVSISFDLTKRVNKEIDLSHSFFN